MCQGIDTGRDDNIRDGLEMLVRFYDNHGSLKQVANKSGVTIENLRKWLDGGVLSESDRRLLSKDVEPPWNGPVKIR